MNHKHSMANRPQRPRGQGWGRARLLTPGRVPGPGPAALPGTPHAAAAAGSGVEGAPPGPARAPGTPARPGGSLSPGCRDRTAVLGTSLCTGPPPKHHHRSRGKTVPHVGLSFPICNMDLMLPPPHPRDLSKAGHLAQCLAWGRLHTWELLPTHSAAPSCHFSDTNSLVLCAAGV